MKAIYNLKMLQTSIKRRQWREWKVLQSLLSNKDLKDMDGLQKSVVVDDFTHCTHLHSTLIYGSKNRNKYSWNKKE